MFQDEPEEQPKEVGRKRLFGEEPEEQPRSNVKKKPLIQRQVMFGDEPEERQPRVPSMPSRPSSSSLRSSEIADEKFEDDGNDYAGNKIVSLNWSGMKLFANSIFLQKGASKEMPKKRHYDNTGRTSNAEFKEDHSFKKTALDPERLSRLCKKPECKCSWADLGGCSFWVLVWESFLTGHNVILFIDDGCGFCFVYIWPRWSERLLPETQHEGMPRIFEELLELVQGWTRCIRNLNAN